MNIGVVIVTYNRIEKLKKALECYETQEKKPKYIVVVDNKSTDDTNEFLKDWALDNKEIEKYVITLDQNMGGSGGFYEGLKRSLELDCDWIWVADDDAYPKDDAIYKIDKFLESKSEKELNEISAVCGVVRNADNSIDLDHRRRINIGAFTVKEEVVSKTEYDKEFFEIDLLSYVGSVISKRAMKEVGITEKDYFIHFDDSEHGYRLSRVGKIICLTDVEIIHDVMPAVTNEISWKVYYAERNRLFFLKKHFNFRYFWLAYVKAKISSKRKSKSMQEIVNAYLSDAKNNVQGMHSIYKPGWKYKEY